MIFQAIHHVPGTTWCLSISGLTILWNKRKGRPRLIKSRKFRISSCFLMLAVSFVWLLSVFKLGQLLNVLEQQLDGNFVDESFVDGRVADLLPDDDGQIIDDPEPYEEFVQKLGGCCSSDRKKPSVSDGDPESVELLGEDPEVTTVGYFVAPRESASRPQAVQTMEYHPPRLPGIADRSGQFILHAFHRTADNWENLRERKVCLATQTSVDRLHWLVNSSSTWTGHVSVTVLGPAEEFYVAQLAIDFLRECSHDIRDRVSFHLVSLARHPPEPIPAYAASELLHCSNIEQSLRALQTEMSPPSMNSWRETLPHPQNLMRNWAKSGCGSERILVADVDMIPSRGMADELEEFLSDETGNPIAACSKCLLIVPTYEVSERMGRFPDNKTELLSWLRMNEARGFHSAIWPRSCRSSKLEIWEKHPTSPKTDIAYDIKEIELQYEPIYVGPANGPAYDERFVGYGHDRYTQFYEMYLANYSFHVLANPFTSHWKFQEESGRPAWRKQQRADGILHAWEFAKEVVSKYGRDPLGFEPYMRKKAAPYLRRLHKIGKINPSEF